MLFSLLVTLREGVEIALVVTILLGYLRSLDQRQHFRAIWLGVVAAAALSLAFAAALEITSRELDGRVLEAFEGFTMLFAVAVLTWMVFWMKRQSAGISRDLREQVDTALSRGSIVALALLAFSSVGREGIETTLFLFAGSKNAGSGVEFVAGGVAGFAISAVIGIVLYYGSARIPLKPFFLVTGVVVVFLAGGLLSNGLAELHEAMIIGDLGSRPWDMESVIPMTSTFGKFLHTVLGYDSAPLMGQIVLYWGFILTTLAAYFIIPVSRPPQVRRVERAPAAPTITEA